MHIVIAPDSFKESLTAQAVAQAIQAGFARIFPDASYTLVPMADGGEGTVQSFVDATGGKLMESAVTSPLGETVQAQWGLSGDGRTAIIEMAAASGLHLVPMDKRNPEHTTSFGTGELIKTALCHEVEDIILGIGGSATNDGGIGMLQALGAHFYDDNGDELAFGGAALASLARVDLSQLDERLSKVRLSVACDVDNPLTGEHGAAAVFGAQKGADEAMIKRLDHALGHFAEVVERELDKAINDVKGAGAAGGMGAGLMLLPNVALRSGVEIMLNAVGLESKVRSADLVITGEGRMDGQTVHGKTPIGVARCAKAHNKPVIALVGCLRADYVAVYDHGIDAVFPIIQQLDSLENTLKCGAQNLQSCAENVARLYKLATAL